MGRFQTDGSTDYSLPVANVRITAFYSNVGIGRFALLHDCFDSAGAYLYEGGNVLFGTGKVNVKQVITEWQC